ASGDNRDRTCTARAREAASPLVRVSKTSWLSLASLPSQQSPHLPSIRSPLFAAGFSPERVLQKEQRLVVGHLLHPQGVHDRGQYQRDQDDQPRQQEQLLHGRQKT